MDQLERYGGAFNAIVGTLMQTALAAVISIPLGILVATTWSRHSDGRLLLARITTFMVDILSGVPSIVVPCSCTPCGARRWVHRMVRPIALVLLMVPLVVRSTEEMLKIVPQDLREGLLRAGRTEVEDHRPGGAADRAVGHRHRRDAGHRPGDG